jgi:lipid-A-disaccharide synthase
MKKIFILVGEASGDKLASKVISQLKKTNLDIEYLSVGGENLKKLGIKSIFNMNEITYLGFTKVLLNLFKIKRKINETVNEILKFNTDILFSIDSPDFTLRVAKKVKKLNHNIKTIHYVAPQVWVWRKGRANKIKHYIDHLLLLFKFEEEYFDKNFLKISYVGHPLLDYKKDNKSDLSNLININKKIISIFPGSRLSEINTLMPILLKFVLLSQSKKNNYLYVFHTNQELKSNIDNFLKVQNVKDCEIISDDNIKREILSKSFFAIAKSGTISLEISNANIPSLIIYKMNFFNFFILKLLIKVKYANIFNIISNNEIIPELLQTNCNENKIYETFDLFMKNPELIKKQLFNCNKILDNMKTNSLSSQKVANILNDELKNL